MDYYSVLKNRNGKKRKELEELENILFYTIQKKDLEATIPYLFDELTVYKCRKETDNSFGNYESEVKKILGENYNCEELKNWFEWFTQYATDEFHKGFCYKRIKEISIIIGSLNEKELKKNYHNGINTNYSNIRPLIQEFIKHAKNLEVLLDKTWDYENNPRFESYDPNESSYLEIGLFKSFTLLMQLFFLTPINIRDAEYNSIDYYTT